MRLDKFLSVCAVASRTDSKRAVRGGEVFVNGICAKTSDMAVDPEEIRKQEPQKEAPSAIPF